MKIQWKNSSATWGLMAIAMHWITAFAVVVLFIVGLWMTDLNYDSKWYKIAPFIHKSVGILLLILTLCRVVWRMVNKAPKPLDTHTKEERIMGGLMHLALYILLFSIMIAGYLISTADGRAISVFNWFAVPATITSIPKQEEIAGFVHLYLAYTIIGMVGLHALAALKHHIVDKDNTLRRMLGRKNL